MSPLPAERQKLLDEYAALGGKWDRLIQRVLIAVGGGVICCPCATVRLCGHSTDWFDPSELPGIDSCFPAERGYIVYTMTPWQGTGYTQKQLDQKCVISAAVVALAASGVVIAKMV